MIEYIITKETIHNIQFAVEDVLATEQEKRQRKFHLEKAMRLGNLYKNHVTISFKNNKFTRLKTTATIWAVTEKYVVLKSHIMIPIHCIYEVDFATDTGLASVA